MKTQQYPTWIEINKQALLRNYRLFTEYVSPKTFCMAVIKSNAYGHGLIETAHILNATTVDWFGVDSFDEAIQLRTQGITKPILVFGYTPRRRLATAIQQSITLTVADQDMLRDIVQENKHKPHPLFHLKIDTGMHRQGFTIEALPKVLSTLTKSHIQPTGVYTHFSSAGNITDPSITNMQIQLFQQANLLIEAAGFHGLIKHAAATAGCIAFPTSHFDMVRIGLGLYGLWPSHAIRKAFEKKLPLQPVLVWKTIISQIKQVQKNDAIGYDATEQVKKPTVIAILPIGYWHGVPRSLSSIGHVLIHGQKAKILGRVSMDMISVDITTIPNIKREDEAIIIGDNCSADVIAEQTGTINYEITTRINPLIPRKVQ
ncbi:MAG: alanine racemase [Microgenomates group bacterium]